MFPAESDGGFQQLRTTGSLQPRQPDFPAQPGIAQADQTHSLLPAVAEHAPRQYGGAQSATYQAHDGILPIHLHEDLRNDRRFTEKRVQMSPRRGSLVIQNEREVAQVFRPQFATFCQWMVL